MTKTPGGWRDYMGTCRGYITHTFDVGVQIVKINEFITKFSRFKATIIKYCMLKSAQFNNEAIDYNFINHSSLRDLVDV